MSLFVKFFLFFAASVSSLPAVELVLDAADDSNTLPVNFRTVQDPFAINSIEPPPSREGLDTLMASGSAQFSRKGLKAMRKKLSARRLAIVDLRQESHGHVNDLAISWHVKNNAINKEK